MNLTMPAHLPWLDGLRGVAALWVLLHHVHILVGGPHFPVLSWGGLAVDLFMMVSGFLMAHHYLLSKDRAPWADGSTWRNFWARRWFRLSPLYYLLLTAALLLGPATGSYRAEIAQVWPATATAAERYTDSSAANVLLHLTYVFGAFPEYAFRTALPDWSIGLEAQFYLAFPFIMLLMARIGPVKAGLLLAFACLALRYLFPAFMKSFPMPSFLPLKLYIFVIGIWIAYSQEITRKWVYLVPALLLAAIYVVGERSAESAGRVAVVLGFFALVGGGRFNRVLGRPLSGGVARFMGDTSYALYLLHLLLLIPIAAMLSRFAEFNALHWLFRFTICSLLVLPLSYIGAFLLFKLVEQPGIDLGKRVLRRRSSALRASADPR